MNFIQRVLRKFIKKTEEELKLEREMAESLEMKKDLEQKTIKKQIEEQLRMESSVPWYQLIGQEYDLEKPPIDPISSRYKWNAAFVKDLRERGFKGETDHEVISDWEVRTATDKAARLAQLDRERKKNSDEPWVEVVGEDYDEISKQVAIRLDWNKSFIKMLRANGYTGRDEEQIVDKWFRKISDQIAENSHKENYNE